MRLRLPTALALPAAMNGDLGKSRLKGRLAGKLYHSHGSAQGRSAGFFGSPRNLRRFWRRPVPARLGLSDEGRCAIAAKAGQATTKEATKESMSDTRSELTVPLWRGGQQGRYETYKVPLRENQTVLDVVTFVQR